MDIQEQNVAKGFLKIKYHLYKEIQRWLFQFRCLDLTITVILPTLKLEMQMYAMGFTLMTSNII